MQFSAGMSASGDRSAALPAEGVKGEEPHPPSSETEASIARQFRYATGLFALQVAAMAVAWAPRLF